MARGWSREDAIFIAESDVEHEARMFDPKIEEEEERWARKHGFRKKRKNPKSKKRSVSIRSLMRKALS